MKEMFLYTANTVLLNDSYRKNVKNKNNMQKIDLINQVLNLRK